ncbi:hypothetical protein P152DRAFT_458457 [Eremomyces bilateralis CBS 781.70]|uniref:SIN1-domain-containing protein n=1 Tax=Eremomyces bilateralis CBS 781.70 TaxID=1392243 RepID=A0A6G1G3X8_9PEZI|nr:uncharacterized protein P152DRAFT_458457 [Eremomyces bilateralis CBS 781.70]KAF1812641.1 hypothetical protein P152DRAFT_458457 [Eremomyces bilateralis CBS 781.70]
MSLLQDEDFVLYQLRTSYLANIKDGVGERLINVNTSVLNNPAYRAAGWTLNQSDIKRTYSPPIPTAITADYFQAPRSAGVGGKELEDDDEGGMITGGAASGETVGPGLNTKRRRRREQIEEEDSSDLSDETDEDEDGFQRAAQQIKFSKMPVRNRAGSSPSIQDGPAVLVTSPSRPPDGRGLRRGSLGQLGALTRPRRDTTTSSDMSSDNELGPPFAQIQQGPRAMTAKTALFLSESIQEERRPSDVAIQDVDVAEDSDSTLSSEFAGSADSGSILGPDANDSISPLQMRLNPIVSPSLMNTSPKKSRHPPPILQALPPPRPISMLPPVSALTQALVAKDKGSESPFQRFASLSGKGDPNPLYIKIYAPFSKRPTKPYEVLMMRASHDGSRVSVADAIGLALWRFGDEAIEPPLSGLQMNVNAWTLRMVEDEEVDMDFPALVRTRPISDFTSNNNRARLRSREKPWDEFALVAADEAQFKDNEAQTPEYSREAAAAKESQDVVKREESSPALQRAPPASFAPSSNVSAFRNPIIGPAHTAEGFRRNANLMDTPAAPAPQATPRTGVTKSLVIRFTDDSFLTRTVTIETTTDTYLADVFDQVCKKFNVDKGLYILKVGGTSTVAPNDRIVEALGDRSELDLTRRRFVGEASFGLSGSPGSSTPNAPLFISPGGTTKKGKKGAPTLLNPLAQKHDALFSIANYKRYNVTRKQPMSFSSSSARIMALDGEYLHLMPSESGAGGTKALFDVNAKTSAMHYSTIVGCKVSRRHPRMFRVIIYRERESKRYDFEAQSRAEAVEIVDEIKTGVRKFQNDLL